MCLRVKHMGHNRHVLSTTTSTGKTRTRDGHQPAGTLGGAVEPTQSVARRSRGRWLILLGILLSALTLSGIAASPAMAETGSAATEAEEEFEYFFVGQRHVRRQAARGRADQRSRATATRPRPRPTPRASGASASPRRASTSSRSTRTPFPRASSSRRARTPSPPSSGSPSCKAVNFFLGEGQRTTTDISAQVLIRVINGLNFGLLLALAAIGLSLIFGTTGLSNFAHAEMITFGGVDGAHLRRRPRVADLARDHHRHRAERGARLDARRHDLETAPKARRRRSSRS